jgi:hypothetical protein
MNSHALETLSSMYDNIQQLLKDVANLQTYKQESQTVIKAIMQTNTELVEEIKKLKLSSAAPATSTNSFFSTTPAKSSFSAVAVPNTPFGAAHLTTIPPAVGTATATTTSFTFPKTTLATTFGSTSTTPGTFGSLAMPAATTQSSAPNTNTGNSYGRNSMFAPVKSDGVGM